MWSPHSMSMGMAEAQTPESSPFPGRWRTVFGLKHGKECSVFFLVSMRHRRPVCHSNVCPLSLRGWAEALPEFCRATPTNQLSRPHWWLRCDLWWDFNHPKLGYYMKQSRKSKLVGSYSTFKVWFWCSRGGLQKITVPYSTFFSTQVHKLKILRFQLNRSTWRKRFFMARKVERARGHALATSVWIRGLTDLHKYAVSNAPRPRCT